jgi:hypothetical protein
VENNIQTPRLAKQTHFGLLCEEEFSCILSFPPSTFTSHTFRVRLIRTSSWWRTASNLRFQESPDNLFFSPKEGVHLPPLVFFPSLKKKASIFLVLCSVSLCSLSPALNSHPFLQVSPTRPSDWWRIVCSTPGRRSRLTSGTARAGTHWAMLTSPTTSARAPGTLASCGRPSRRTRMR